MGIAVSTATDVAKSGAGIVLTEPGLAGTTARRGGEFCHGALAGSRATDKVSLTPEIPRPDARRAAEQRFTRGEHHLASRPYQPQPI
jgi:hypothetical protein